MENIDIQQAVEYAKELGVEFADIRYEQRSFLSIQIVNGSIRSINNALKNGISIRVLKDGAWGYTSTTNLSREQLKKSIEHAVTLAKISSEKLSTKKKLELPVKSITKKVSADMKINPADISLEEKIKYLLELDDIQRKYDARIINSNVRYTESLLRVQLVNTSGSLLEWEEPRISLVFVTFAKENEKLQYAYHPITGSAGYELVNQLDPSDVGIIAARDAVNLLSAKKPPSGSLTVIADPSISGLLAHEVMGHASEGDEIVKRRSFLTDAVGKIVASELITMVDDGTIKGAYGSIPFDSEGTPSSRTVIIEKGVYKGYMHNLETATIMGVEPTGNGRAQDFNRRVWVRMTNTFFESGDWDLDEIISDTKEGILAMKAISGMEDPVGGGFESRALMGYTIENGEKKDLIRSFTLTGNALEILKTVDAVSKDFKLDGGFCGKGEEDWVPVTTGGAYLRAKIIVGGG